jgi:multiple sugar transport system permease protein
MSEHQSYLNQTSDLQRQKHNGNLKKNAKTVLAMLLLILIAVYFLTPLYWLIIAATKSTNQLFNTPAFAPHLPLNILENLKSLNSYQNGIFWRWGLNSILFATITASLATFICAMGGYALTKYKFQMSKTILVVTIGAMMIPQAATTIPVFLMVKCLGLINTYIGVILPMLASPFGIYFMSVYIKETMPDELIDAGRVDGASEFMIFCKIAISILRPGLVTLFLIIFIGTWNNFFLPLVLLNQSHLYPLTVGLSIWTTILNSPGAGEPMYPVILVGSFISILPMLVLFPFLRKYIASGITMGSIKS